MITIGTSGSGRLVGGVGVLGTGSCLPAHVVTNDEVGEPAGVTGDWVRAKTDIRTRRRAKPDEATSDLAVVAARAALADAGLGSADVSLLVLATSTPDSPQPATAAVVADGLNLRPGTPAFDVNAVCSGFLFALVTAEGLLRGTGGAGHALVIGADIYSRILNPADRRTAVLFGDGAGAVVLGPVPAGRGLLAGRLAGFSADRDLIEVPGGGSRFPASERTLADGLQYFTMNGRGVREFVTEQVPGALRDFLRAAELTVADVDHFVPHQANGRMLRELAAATGLPWERTRTTYTDFGNTGSASVPITLDHAARSGLVAEGDAVLLAGFGGGMALGLGLLRW
ncbi:3-oxoacyl-ACP synthase III family protein [Actinokineospora globicatena]|uniref:3-oxoacyl-ACP synthase III family protein n=1 Tax=Actinokineospora globicatena TaxID=103729 RepID=UPI0020A49A6B|nr:ketoacyl-ACP synthase III [Actinokineospora globicatena]MCP2303160.1 3-oxoacyl-[acyl-carrier-protein] synthase-3 [Actinokineospora globicatena]GLW79723.1 3-oxoacyl-[acyl-carrier-protein] synthase 3 [Actinokineospora globicatena]GLW85867.1 3-oxoacyl-[acyl-carrier-protein] synthase 3 [Actinokineospora globicatena]